MVEERPKYRIYMMMDTTKKEIPIMFSLAEFYSEASAFCFLANLPFMHYMNALCDNIRQTWKTDFSKENALKHVVKLIHSRLVYIGYECGGEGWPPVVINTKQDLHQPIHLPHEWQCRLPQNLLEQRTEALTKTIRELEHDHEELEQRYRVLSLKYDAMIYRNYIAWDD